MNSPPRSFLTLSQGNPYACFFADSSWSGSLTFPLTNYTKLTSFANKPLRRKYQILLFLLVAVICGIPAIGALFGLALIGGLIGTTFRRSESGALQVALVSTVTALLYVGMGGYLLMTGPVFTGLRDLHDTGFWCIYLRQNHRRKRGPDSR
ncbi:Uncharacterised protein [Kluyvera cryocrescens]|uniref:Uncharacterized protein n=1 Tax=Kluyvera cryocrescens TaxID=580 RepID=A0A485B2V3_KLUCR|nr:Uncharacterised protein [Kluyvera cryocrescens]